MQKCRIQHTSGIITCTRNTNLTYVPCTAALPGHHKKLWNILFFFYCVSFSLMNVAVNIFSAIIHLFWSCFPTAFLNCTWFLSMCREILARFGSGASMEVQESCGRTWPATQDLFLVLLNFVGWELDVVRTHSVDHVRTIEQAFNSNHMRVTTLLQTLYDYIYVACPSAHAW